ncbi:hypothetical protein [Galbibacter sp. PAP.153]|uniref:hypothetical protein n=1 Tax=Galbibacter sp. PAP.153 TaxID=3104623 RepID=UPI00300A85E8
MVATTILLMFMGFYALYSSSKRAVLNQSKFDLWLQEKYSPLKATGLLLITIALGVAILHKGFASGIFYWFIILMTLGSLIVLVSPLRVFNYKAIATTLICIVFIENFLI